MNNVMLTFAIVAVFFGLHLAGDWLGHREQFVPCLVKAIGFYFVMTLLVAWPRILESLNFLMIRYALHQSRAGRHG